MTCTRWNDDWIAHLYGELDPAEERSLNEHLAACAACRGEMGRLEEVRLLLHASSEADSVPSRVMVLSPARRLRPVLAFAAGVLCAAVLFVAGSFTGGTLRQEQSVPEPAPGTVLEDSALLGAIDEQNRRLERLEQVVREPRPVVSDPAVLTRDDFRRSIDQLETRWQQDRARELEFLVRSISAAQARVDETQEALQVLAVRDDPRYRER